MVPVASVQVVAHRPDLPGARRRLDRASSGKQWNQTLLHYAVFEIVVDALKRTKNVDDKQIILDAIKATDLDTIQGHITWSAGAPLNPVPNVCRTVLVGGMWTKGTDYPFDLLLVDTQHAKEAPFDVDHPDERQGRSRSSTERPCRTPTRLPDEAPAHEEVDVMQGGEIP